VYVTFEDPTIEKVDEKEELLIFDFGTVEENEVIVVEIETFDFDGFMTDFSYIFENGVVLDEIKLL